MNDHSPSDEQLAQKALEDLDVFGQLIERYEQKLTRYILRISAFTSEEAEEILQESFLKAWKNLNDFDPSLTFSSWIYRITHNQTISQFRKSQSKGKDQQAKWDPKLFEVIPDELNIPEQFDRQETAKLVRETLKELSEPYREVLVLRFFEDKSYEEISDILKKPSGTVSTLLNRAKKTFRDLIQHSPILNPTP